MTNMQDTAIKYIRGLPQDKLVDAVDYLRHLYEAQEDYPLDEFDYELSQRADEAKDTETVSLDEVLRKAGLTYEDLQN